MNLTWALVEGLVLGALFTLVVLVEMRRRPRGLLHMLPARFHASGPAPTRAETRGFYRRYLPALLVIAGCMALAGRMAYAGTDVGGWELFLHGYVVGMFLNLGDAIWLDLVEIGTRRTFYADAWGVDPELLRPASFFRLLTFREHCLQWPLLYCPVIGLLNLVLVRAALSL